MCQKFTRRNVLVGLTATTALAGLSACARNRATGRSSFTGLYSLEDDIALGRKEHPRMVKEFGGEYDDRALQKYLDQLGQKLAGHSEYQEFNFTFTLLNTPIVNAFALPGGYVYVSRGLLALASNEAELAGVVAHEIGHVTARHTAERMSSATLAQIGVLAGAIGAAALGLPSQVADLGQTAAVAAIQSYSRSQELEADTLGIRYMSDAGYDPNAMVTFLATLREHSIVEVESLGGKPGDVDEYNIMATHPRTIERVKQAENLAAAQVPANPRIGRKEYLSEIDGMLFGDDPEQGIAEGQRFVHPGLRFEFKAPDGFRIINRPEQVIAKSKQGAAMIFDIAKTESSSTMKGYLVNEWAGDLPLDRVESLEINGMKAATATARVRSNSGQEIDIRPVAARREGSSVFRLLYITPIEQTADLSESLRRSTYSLRRISEDEAQQIKPLRLKIREARSGDTISELSKKLPYGTLNDAFFRVLNDLKPGEGLTAGEMIKVVTV